MFSFLQRRHAYVKVEFRDSSGGGAPWAFVTLYRRGKRPLYATRVGAWVVVDEGAVIPAECRLDPNATFRGVNGQYGGWDIGVGFDRLGRAQF